jgi:hypothetical protein
MQASPGQQRCVISLRSGRTRCYKVRSQGSIVYESAVVLRFRRRLKSSSSSATSSNVKIAVFLAQHVPTVRWHDAIRHVERIVVQPASVCFMRDALASCVDWSDQICRFLHPFLRTMYGSEVGRDTGMYMAVVLRRDPHEAEHLRWVR